MSFLVCFSLCVMALHDGCSTTVDFVIYSSEVPVSKVIGQHTQPLCTLNWFFGDPSIIEYWRPRSSLISVLVRWADLAVGSSLVSHLVRTVSSRLGPFDVIAARYLDMRRGGN